MGFFLQKRGIKNIELKIGSLSWVPMTHAYNLSYSGGRDQEDQSLKPALGK
jgi:hypothetical protein